ncbi:TrlF family AAA-like ATPase [Methylobacterium sp. yr668]|uniref:TrlF family AAA-like ATPase n=1 Tax=Methylobacterium sp. yr668 TaxID=1761801 RepID=UPI000B2F638D|nr:AAA family ATPase [Methylobacterium sp. yr668]
MTDMGAHFHKCDFQVHSPRDGRWTGSKPVTPEDRLAYAKALVAACREKGLQAIAVTDHHDMAFVSYVRQAAREERDVDGNLLPAERQIVVFPGMELTLGVPCQAIIIFDADFPEDMFTLAMTAMTIVQAAASEASNGNVTRLDHIQSLLALKTDLDRHTYLKGKYTVFPNVSDGGTATLLRSGNQGKYVEMPWVGGYVDGPVDRLGTGNKQITSGRNGAYGNKRIAVLQTSDSRREDHEHLGQHSTWIKWAIPTAEALRQACLAQESRISHVEPVLPQRVIESLSVSNSGFLGPVDVELSSQYTALIGGRGTGKSTILEYLRWGLCDQPPTDAGEDAPRYEKRRDQLVADTLKALKAKVDIKFRINGVSHHARRDSETGKVMLKVGDEEFRPCSEAELRGILPIQAYSQKQLSDVSVRLDELFRFITTPVQEQLERNRQQIQQSADQIRALYANKLRKRSIEREIQRGQLTISSLTQQVASLRSSISGLSQEDQDVISKSQLYTEADQNATAWRRSLSEIESIATQLTQKIAGAAEKAKYLCEHDELSAVSNLCTSFQGFLHGAQDHARAIVSSAGTLKAAKTASGADAWEDWQARLKDFRARYEAAISKDSAHAQKLQQIAGLETRLVEANASIASAQEALNELLTAEAALDAERQRWRDLIAARAGILSGECSKLTAASEGIIRAEVRQAADGASFAERLREAVQGSGVTRAKLDGLIERMLHEDDRQRSLEGVLEDLEALANFDSAQQGNEQLPATPTLSRYGLTANELRKITAVLNSDRWLQLALTPLAEVPVFQYRSREGEYIPFKNASAGQQATALLKTLLNQEGPPLIIDQPEEDLDNPVILEIVSQLWTAKSRRQIIFASHNANLVVNGDAELVVWCDYRTTADQSGGKIAGQGAIDVHSIRDAIKQVMEGGEDAFNLRMRKYGF